MVIKLRYAKLNFSANTISENSLRNNFILKNMK